jgi:hypothetical protein
MHCVPSFPLCAPLLLYTGYSPRCRRRVWWRGHWNQISCHQGEEVGLMGWRGDILLEALFLCYSPALFARTWLHCFLACNEMKKKKNADSINTTGMDLERMLSCVLHHLMDAKTQHPTWWMKLREAFQWGSGGWEAEACTPPGVLLRYFWGLCPMSHLICVIFVAGFIACRLDFSWWLWSGILVWLL